MSLKEISKITGVSPSTVSRVLSGKNVTCASPETRDAIFETAARMNYHPNSAAQQLRNNVQIQEKSLRAGIILARKQVLEDDPFFLELFQKLKIEFYTSRIQFTGIVKEDAVDKEDTDGFIILGRGSDALIEQIRKKTANIVGLSRNPLDFSLDEVVCNGASAATLAVEHLLSFGHRKIAYIGDCSYESRYVGYCETLIRHNLPINYQIIIQTDQSYASGQTAMEKILSSGQATAVLCANDISALGALQAQKGLRQNRRLCVISIDDIDEAQESKPMLTTVHISRQDMAHMAVLLLKDRMQGSHKDFLRVEIPCHVVQRDSVWRIT